MRRNYAVVFSHEENISLKTHFFGSIERALQVSVILGL